MNFSSFWPFCPFCLSRLCLLMCIRWFLSPLVSLFPLVHVSACFCLRLFVSLLVALSPLVFVSACLCLRLFFIPTGLSVSAGYLCLRLCTSVFALKEKNKGSFDISHLEKYFYLVKDHWIFLINSKWEKFQFWISAHFDVFF